MGYYFAIDVGNTNTSFAVRRGEAIVTKWRLATEMRRTADEYAVTLMHLCQQHGLQWEDIHGVIIASVVPHTVNELQAFSMRYLKTAPIMVDTTLRKTIRIGIEKPQELGADHMVNAEAAYAKYKQAAIVVDFGTATNFDVVTSEGEYRGGVIAPGIHLSIAALHKAAAKLPSVDVSVPDRVIGNNTVSAMQSGIYWGYTGLLEGVIRRIQDELGEPSVTLATGGLASLFCASVPAIDVCEPDLTIEGLCRLYQLNVPQ